MDNWQICVMGADNETGFAAVNGDIRIFDSSAPGVLWDAGKTLRDVSISFSPNDEGLLLVPFIMGGGSDEISDDASPAVRWTAMEAPPAVRWTAMEAAAARQGWLPTSAGYRAHETGWLTWKNIHTDARIHMGVLSLMDQDRTPLFKLDSSTETIIKAILAYHTAVGSLWRMTPGVSGCTGIRATVKARKEASTPAGEPHWRWDKAPEEVHGVGYPIWTRPLTDAEKHGFVYSFDIKAQYLAAMAAARLGWGEPHAKAQPVFDATRAGYWQIAAPKAADDVPWLINPKKIDKWGLTWVTTPIMVYLQQLGIEPLVYHSWTSATSSEFLKPWAHRLRDSITAQAMICPPPALKRTYAEAIGMMAVPGGTIFRPDWRDTIVDLARANMFRKIDRAHKTMGVWPVEIYHDAVHYPGGEADHRTIADALGVKIGQTGKFQHTGHMSALQWLQRKEDKSNG